MLIWLTTRNSEGEDRRLLVNPDQIQFAREINSHNAKSVVTFAGTKYSDGSRKSERVIFTVETLDEIYAKAQTPHVARAVTKHKKAR